MNPSLTPTRSGEWQKACNLCSRHVQIHRSEIWKFSSPFIWVFFFCVFSPHITGTSVCGWKGPCLCPATWGWWSLSRAIRLCWEMTRRKPPVSLRTSVKGECLMVAYIQCSTHVYHTHETMLCKNNDKKWFVYTVCYVLWPICKWTWWAYKHVCRLLLTCWRQTMAPVFLSPGWCL